MDNGLTPREIQTRIRGGEPVEEVAKSAGVSLDHLQVFAGPVLAERRHVSGTAQSGPVRRRGESSSGRSLSSVVNDSIAQLELTGDDVTWDAWRDPDRRWTVKASYTHGDNTHDALFTYDLRGRFSVAANDDARWLIGEVTAATATTVTKSDPDSEETLDLNDEMALVRATQPGASSRPTSPGPTSPSPAGTGSGTAQSVVTEKSDATDPEARRAATSASTVEQPAGGSRGGTKLTRRRATRAADDEPEPADYAEAELTEVGGVYDIVPPQGDMDVLYDMLSSFNEDSVNIYAGLTGPVVDDDSEPDSTLADHDEAASDSELESDVAPETDQPETVAPETDQPETDQPETDQPETDQPSAGTSSPVASDEAVDAIDEPQQDSLLTEEQEPTLVRPRSEVTAAAPKPKNSRRKRAQVPSWDEIMFGSPAPKDPKA